MSAIPVVINCLVYPRNKTVAPFPATIVGAAYNPDLSVGGGPVEPPPDIKPPPEWGIWPNPPEGIAPIPGHPIALPGDPWWPDSPPPDQTPPQVQPPHLGWNWSEAKGQWYWFYLYVPGSGQAQPKK